MQIIPAAHGGKRPQWIASKLEPVTHGTITAFTRDGKRSLVSSGENGLYIDREEWHVIGMEWSKT